MKINIPIDNEDKCSSLIQKQVTYAPNGPLMSLHSLEVEQNGTGSITLDNVKGSALRLRGAVAYVMMAAARVENI